MTRERSPIEDDDAGELAWLVVLALLVLLGLATSGCASPSRMGVRSVTACIEVRDDRGRGGWTDDRTHQRGASASVCTEFGE